MRCPCSEEVRSVRSLKNDEQSQETISFFLPWILATSTSSPSGLWSPCHLLAVILNSSHFFVHLCLPEAYSGRSAFVPLDSLTSLSVTEMQKQWQTAIITRPCLQSPVRIPDSFSFKGYVSIWCDSRDEDFQTRDPVMADIVTCDWRGRQARPVCAKVSFIL